MKVKLNSVYETPIMLIVVRAIILENNEYYPLR